MFAVRSRWLGALCAMTVLLGASSAQAQQLKLLPTDTEMVISINWNQILKSDLATSNREILEILKAKVREQLEEKGADTYLKKAGFDMFRDLTSITIGIPGGRPPEQAFVILEGKFDADKIDVAATAASNDNGGIIKTVKIGGVKAYEISIEEQTAYVGVLGKKYLVAASAKSDFADAVQAFNGESPNKIKRELKSLMELGNTKQSISIVALGSMMTKMAEKAPQAGNGPAAEYLKKLDGMNIGITIAKNIDFQFGLTTKDNETASGLAGMTNLLVTGARAQVKKKAEDDEKFVPAMEVLNSVRATAQGSNMILRAQITAESLGKILQNLPFGN